MKKIAFLLIALVAQIGFSQDEKEPMADGKFKPNWESLAQYEIPDWFQDAKFGIWAHWGPQCQPEAGDWYGKHMYEQGHWQYEYHLKHYGHPSKVGFKDVIKEWKAEAWDPEALVALYKRAGAKYFFAMGNHHDNLDLWDSKHQKWNSVNLGPKKDILQGWATAAKNNDLPFGVSIHSAHAWQWYENSQTSDKTGPLAGVPYDGTLKKEDGEGAWWEGYDPQNLYAQNHPLSKPSREDVTGEQWNWENGASIPSEAYCTNFYNRTVDMINKYAPDLIYFDDTAVPLWPISNVGLEVASHYYNASMKQNNGKLNGVLFGKILTEDQKKALVWDVERGAPDAIQEQPWQSCTCIGNWHYKREIYEKDQYKSAKTVIQILADIVSKNGNLLLNIPVRGNGTIDEKELKIIQDITAWMDVNQESIFETRPWQVYGEGPRVDAANPLKAQGFNEGKGKPYTAQDIRFTTKGDVLYAIVMERPENNNTVVVRSLGKQSPFYKKYKNVSVLGGEVASSKYKKDGLYVELKTKEAAIAPLVIKIY